MAFTEAELSHARTNTVVRVTTATGDSTEGGAKPPEPGLKRKPSTNARPRKGLAPRKKNKGGDTAESMQDS